MEHLPIAALLGLVEIETAEADLWWNHCLCTISSKCKSKCLFGIAKNGTGLMLQTAVDQ